MYIDKKLLLTTKTAPSGVPCSGGNGLITAVIKTYTVRMPHIPISDSIDFIEVRGRKTPKKQAKGLAIQLSVADK